MMVQFVYSSEIQGSVLFRVIEFEALLAASVGAKSIAISGKLRLVLLQAGQTFSSQELIYSHVGCSYCYNASVLLKAVNFVKMK